MWLLHMSDLVCTALGSRTDYVCECVVWLCVHLLTAWLCDYV